MFLFLTKRMNYKTVTNFLFTYYYIIYSKMLLYYKPVMICNKNKKSWI